ncbi:hypothetical protein ACE6H2_017539 [Prunus campanulata]
MSTGFDNISRLSLDSLGIWQAPVFGPNEDELIGEVLGKDGLGDGHAHVVVANDGDLGVALGGGGRGGAGYRLEEGLGLVFSRPAKMVIISNKDDYDRAIKQVTDSNYVAASILSELRQNFPHVTIYKIFQPPATDMEEILVNMVPDYMPSFHCFQNGEKVFEVDLYQWRSAFEQLYSYVVPIGTTQATGSSGMEERRAEQLVIQAKKDENDKEVGGGFKVGSGRALSQRRSAATLGGRVEGGAGWVGRWVGVGDWPEKEVGGGYKDREGSGGGYKDR